MAVRIVTIVVDRSTPPVVRRFDWIPNAVQAVVENAPWRHKSPSFDYLPTEPYDSRSKARFLGPQPAYTESVTRWRHPPPTFDWPEGVSLDKRSFSRFLGPQPNYTEQVDQWRKPYTTFDWPDRESKDNRSFSRFLEAAPSFVENIPWRHPSPSFEWLEGIASSIRLGSKLLGPQPSYNEQSPWKHPVVKFDVLAEADVIYKKWFAGLTSPLVVVDYLPWKKRQLIALDELKIDSKVRGWFAGLTFTPVVAIDYLPWKKRQLWTPDAFEYVPSITKFKQWFIGLVDFYRKLAMKDAVLETSTSTGLGDMTLGGAVAGFTTFAIAGVNNGDLVDYSIRHQSAIEWESGRGVYNSAGSGSITRITVTQSSNGPGVSVNFGGGLKHIALTLSEKFANDLPMWVFPPPANSSSTGYPGQRSYDANFEYVCVALNTWKRSAISAF